MFFAALAAVVASKKLPPNNARHKPPPNPTDREVVALGLAVVLDLAVITTGALVVTIGAVLTCVVAIVSVYLFVGNVMLLTLGGVESGNRSIIIGSEDSPDDGRSLIAFGFVFKFTV